MQYPHINTTYIKDLNKLESDCDTNFEQGLASKFFYMRTWLQNINFHAGNQWLVYDESKQVFEIDPQLDDEIKLTINKILPAARMAVGKITQDRKRPIVVPRNQDEEAIEAAKVSTHLLEHERRISNGLYREKQVVSWAALCGKGYTKKYWDDDEGRVCTDVIPPFEVIVPPNVLRSEKMPWICHARYETRAWVYERYGLEVEGTSDWGQFGVFLSAVKNVMQEGNFTGSYTQGIEDNVMVKDWWIRPCKEYPLGALVISVNDKVIYADKNPYMKDVTPPKQGKVLSWDDYYWPFAEFDWFDAPYRYWPISLVENLVDPQKWINEFHSNNVENLQYANAPTWWAQEGTVVADEVSRKPGSVNFYSGQTKPEPDATRAIDPVVYTESQQLEQIIGEISGIHFFGPGSLPPGVHAAAALAIINEQDQIASMAVSINHERWVRDDANQTLYLMKQFGPDSMLVRVMGEEGQWETAEWKKAFISGDEEIKVESKQELAQDKMTKFDQVLKLMTTQKPPEPILESNQGLRMLDMEKDAGLVTPRMLNRNMAMEENRKLWKGETIQVFEFEDHKTHIEAHLEEMLTIRYKMSDDQAAQNAFQQHLRDHQTHMNAAQQTNANSTQVGQTQTDQMMPQQQQPVPPQMQGFTGLAAPLAQSVTRMQQGLQG